MTFKWPGAPSPRAPAHELADFAELTAWQDGNASTVSLARPADRLAENDHSANGVLEDEEAEPAIDDAFVELERRREGCGGAHAYPFGIAANGNVLRTVPGRWNTKRLVYLYLLLATRLRMDRNRLHAGLDGTQLFELLSAAVARGYLGARADSLVFGAAAGSARFADKIDDLCRRIGEGGGFANRPGVSSHQRDGKLDAVAWKPFSDGSPGKLIVFGQCKTGTHYKDSLSQLQPDGFCRKWLRVSPVVNPVRAFFVSESLSRADWTGVGVDAGLMLDRCRMVDFCDDIDEATRQNIEKWTKAAAAAVDLPESLPESPAPPG